MILKLGMWHWGLKLHKVYTRPQVTIYKTIGLLVCLLHSNKLKLNTSNVSFVPLGLVPLGLALATGCAGLDFEIFSISSPSDPAII